ncbi:MAG: hypothetical protein ACOCVG_01650 [Verrucomicrobiota bacterium]
MSLFLEITLVALVVFLAAGYLLRYFWKTFQSSRRKPCGKKSCGCSMKLQPKRG